MYCDQFGHMKASCPQLAKMVCRLCSEPGHIMKYCPLNHKSCPICGGLRHGSKTCPERNRKQLICYACHGFGHSFRNCKEEPSLGMVQEHFLEMARWHKAYLAGKVDLSVAAYGINLGLQEIQGLSKNLPESSGNKLYPEHGPFYQALALRNRDPNMVHWTRYLCFQIAEQGFNKLILVS